MELFRITAIEIYPCIREFTHSSYYNSISEAEKVAAHLYGNLPTDQQKNVIISKTQVQGNNLYQFNTTNSTWIVEKYHTPSTLKEIRDLLQRNFGSFPDRSAAC